MRRAEDITRKQRHLHDLGPVGPLPFGFVKGQKLGKALFAKRQRNLLFMPRTNAEGKPFVQFVRPCGAIHESLHDKSELACCNSLWDLTSLRGGTMRTFDFPTASLFTLGQASAISVTGPNLKTLTRKNC